MRFFLLSLLLVAAPARAWDDGTTPFVVSPDAVVERMLYLAQPKAGERLVDLGSGDGRQDAIDPEKRRRVSDEEDVASLGIPERADQAIDRARRRCHRVDARRLPWRP